MDKKKNSAPDLRVTLSDGTKLRLSDMWTRQALVLVFLRHFG